ncbi:MAG: hypothetical protein HUJ31_11415 [Pseudomonadales bacterium]|nr:hypothetical protein [Pseudomonadales bacterium]
MDTFEDRIEAQQELLTKAQESLVEIRDEIKTVKRSQLRKNELEGLQSDEESTLAEIEEIQAAIEELKSKVEVIDGLYSETPTTHQVRILQVEGDVKISTGDSTVTPTMAGAIGIGDQVVVSTDSFVEFISTDGSLIQLGEDTTFVIKSIDENRSEYSLSKGRLHGYFDCVEMAGAECRQFSIAPLELEDGEVSFEASDGVEARYYLLDGEALYLGADQGTFEFPAGNMVMVDTDSSVYGPMLMNVDWVEKWWLNF